ncbi:MAG TPA: alpha/beta fold hydrolase [Nevskiaceae bacterium]|nr:alpha/beta fold hydrolase [Nevskiaceae bacterium]
MTPDEHTIQELFIEVGHGHQLYVHEWGKATAQTPIVFLHGGPGGGCGDGHKSYFDPTQHRVIFFDQRGSGRSLPYGSLEHNTTSDLVDDIERIANHLHLKQFVLKGGSWGVALALAYALEHPERVQAMILNGIFTGAQAEIDYFDHGEFRTYFPEAWEKYLAATPKSHHRSPSKYHFAQALGIDPQAARESAFAYSTLEYELLGLDDRAHPNKLDEFDPASAIVEIHYLANRCFIPDRYILHNAHKLTMPIWLVQGRYDMVCPATTAHELHKKLPNSQLIWTIAGHKGSDRANYDAVRALLLQFAGVK